MLVDRVLLQKVYELTGAQRKLEAIKHELYKFFESYEIQYSKEVFAIPLVATRHDSRSCRTKFDMTNHVYGSCRIKTCQLVGCNTTHKYD